MKLKWTLLTSFTLMSALSFRPIHAGTEPHRIEISAKRFEFSPSEITVKKGEPVELVIQSSDVTHGLQFADLDQKVQINKGTPATLSFTPEKAGDFTGQCFIFCGTGHGQMALTLHVIE